MKTKQNKNQITREKEKEPKEEKTKFRMVLCVRDMTMNLFNIGVILLLFFMFIDLFVNEFFQ